MYCGKPVIAFNISSNPEIVSNNESGFLVEHGDLEAFLAKTELLIDDARLRQEMGQKAREIAIDMFSIEKTVTTLEQLLYD
jgi:glycosyltransferase involved in cell wall biosynthesis